MTQQTSAEASAEANAEASAEASAEATAAAREEQEEEVREGDHELLSGLSGAEKHAARLLKAILDSFNRRSGLGLMKGPERYAVLEGRISLAANASRSLFEFWSILSKKMLWPIPPMRVDALILPLVAGLDPEHDRRVVNALRRETQSLVMLARAWHAEERAARRKSEDELEAEWEAVLAGSPAGEAPGEATGEAPGEAARDREEEEEEASAGSLLGNLEGSATGGEGS